MDNHVSLSPCMQLCFSMSQAVYLCHSDPVLWTLMMIMLTFCLPVPWKHWLCRRVRHRGQCPLTLPTLQPLQAMQLRRSRQSGRPLSDIFAAALTGILWFKWWWCKVQLEGDKDYLQERRQQRWEGQLWRLQYQEFGLCQSHSIQNPSVQSRWGVKFLKVHRVSCFNVFLVV